LVDSWANSRRHCTPRARAQLRVGCSAYSQYVPRFSIHASEATPVHGQFLEKGTFTAGELDGPFESYHENGQLEQRGTANMGQKCGEWIEDGKTVTYDPCPPGLEEGN
jgi:hypothetical protein